jgi:hypothetical protein
VVLRPLVPLPARGVAATPVPTAARLLSAFL